MFMKRSVVPALMLATLMIAAGLSAEERRGPRVAVDEPRFDFGTVRPGDRPEHVFTVRNAGDEVLLIERVLSS